MLQQQEADSEVEEPSAEQPHQHIVVADHPIMPWTHLKVGDLVVLRPDPTYQPTEDEVVEEFWVAKVDHLIPNEGKVRVQYFSRQKNKSYVLIDWLSSIPYQSVLVSKIKLTKGQRIKKKDLNTIEMVMDL